jgi:hypothetical protein
MGMLGGIVLIIGITLIAGLIAYFGDRVGHQIGRRRLTLFGLRPKYTSTIIAVGTGMMIAFVVTLLALAFSDYARSAFFRLDRLNQRVNELQAQADELSKRARDTDVVINRGDLLYEQYLRLTPQMTRAAKLKALGAFFDAVVQALDRRYVSLRLKPNRAHASDPEVQKKLAEFIDDPRTQGLFLSNLPVLVLAMADQNLFVNDLIHFAFVPYPDRLLFRSGQTLGSIEVDGGTTIVPTIAYGQLEGAVDNLAMGLGMPGAFARALPTLSEDQVRRMSSEIHSGRGRYYIVAKATNDVFPHTGAIPIAFELQRRPK